MIQKVLRQNMRNCIISLLRLRHQKDFQSLKQNALVKTDQSITRASNRKTKGSYNIYYNSNCSENQDKEHKKMKWFNNPSTLEELKQQYKKLALKHHPDLGGNTADMQEINNEYDLLFARLKNTHATAEGKTYTASTETTETPDEFKNIITYFCV